MRFSNDCGITVRGTFHCTEIELRALDALVGYGVESFIKVFYEKLGRHYMEPHEKGLREFFKTIENNVPGTLRRVDQARKLLQQSDEQIRRDVKPPRKPA